MTLFDLDPYGGPITPKESSRNARSERARSERSEIPTEILVDGWRLIRSRGGMLPYAHLVKSTTTEGAVLTMCNEWGTTLPRFEGDRGQRCPLCDLEAQLA